MSVLIQKQSHQYRQDTGQFLKIAQSNLLEMPQSELKSLISEIEHSRLFNKLFKEDKVIRYNRLNKADISRKFYTIEEDTISGSQIPDMEALLLNKKRIIENIRELGLEKFKKYFLFPEDGLSDEEIARECNFSISRVKEINALVDDMEILGEFYQPSHLNSTDINYTKIASVERTKNGFIIGYFSKVLAKGRYAIDYAVFEQLEASKVLSEQDVKEAKALFKKLEMINRCKETLHHVLNNIIEKQAVYFDSGNTRDMLPLSQKELALKIGIAPSSLSRAIKYRTVETPQSREVTLKSFFPGPKNFKMALLKKVIETETGLSSDTQIQEKLAEKYGVNISRRSVANLRNELKIQPRGDR
jgi:hypothetical protein